MAKEIEEEGILITEYGKNQCGNCHATLRKGDKYCRYCGTKRGEGAFAPYRNVMQCLYGPPPVKRCYTCRACGHRWENITMGGEVCFCPKCGSNKIVSKTPEEEGFGGSGPKTTE